MAPDPNKAAHYIKALDDARCEGNWSAVPEFVRKIRKHAPDRTCLTLAAETECAIAKATDPSGAGRPSTAVSAKDLDTANVQSKLQAAIEGETRFPEDRFQAQVCAGLLHWVAEEFDQAVARLPRDIEGELAQLGTADKVSEWTNISAVKASFIKADCLARSNETAEALSVFDSALPSVSTACTARSAHRQLKVWSELFLAEYCVLHSEALRSNERSLADPNSLACFRSWARYWESMPGPVTGGYGYRGSVPRRQVWLEYYLALTTILELDIPFPTGFLGKITNSASARSQLRIELKKTETAYETLLISETSFPRAEDTREEVESFVKAVVKNWSILCGRGWKEQELGQGGRESLSRGVLDTLYAAATKTYHSTAILRCLFTLHLAVAEFDLAFKAFDSYLDLIRHGKARVDKTGHLEASLDDDGTVLETMSQCILALCRYGGPGAIEKARVIGNELEDWLARLPQLRNGIENENTVPEEDDATALHPQIRPHLIALSWQAIGLSQAHWSRSTYDAASRTEIQTKAIRCLRKSLSQELGRTRDVRSLFALGLLLAERRDLTPAIEIVKTALISNKSADDEQDLYHGPYWQERSLVPLWHLLALLLSARQDYNMAAKACEGAFEQFGDPSVLFGRQDLHFKSEHLNEVEAQDEKITNERRGVVDDMDDTERESVLEVKMTQLALLELLEGPDVAVNASPELMSLFMRLFGNLETKPTMQPSITADTIMPKSSAGTLRSLKGSFFGSTRTRQASMTESEKTTTPSRPQTSATSNAPTIQVTQESESSTEKRHRRLSSVTRRARSESGKRNSMRKRDSSGGRTRTASASSAGTNHNGPTVVDGEVFFTPADELQQSEFFPLSGNRQASTASSISRGRSLHHLESYASQKSRSTNFSEISASGTYTISNPLPLIHFPLDTERRQRSVLLIKVWLMIAGFYRRANMFEDAKGAISEAQKLVGILEAEVAKDPTGSLSMRGNSWAERKGVDELLGDVWAELGNLSVAKGSPYLARSDFEMALTHFPDHPAATIGLSDILLDIYSEKILPPPAIPVLSVPENVSSISMPPPGLPKTTASQRGLPSEPLGLGSSASGLRSIKTNAQQSATTSSSGKSLDRSESNEKLPAPYKATSVPKIDRLAARDRAYGLLSSLTKLGSAWNNAEAWFALARAHEESGQVDKAKEVLWWCVELEEGTGVRGWQCLGSGGYVL
ncbi:putative cargo-transport protein ypp1 [Colletotrichum tanaceti]|uniref:Putative cargo-transport protein ypp1 n=1 Tax=Colletotrichum tanaceti TaxID=1306861 RepID=A0A4U6X4H6_9PEZI|nr:putative cargo-transport protein ypp1 [Colletotrichum tanaceti]TKW50085.1 putative cargo-transport protein ypp1 [Colletotrichum tanaceti]